MDKRIAWLDTIRTIAILFVVIFHLIFEINPDESLRVYGFIGISLFFISSGYALAKFYPSVIDFDIKWFLQRLITICPIYYLTLFTLFSLNAVSILDLFLHFIFINPLISGYEYTIISPAWFLTPLMFFYFMFPYFNRFLQNSNFFLLCILISLFVRINEGGWASISPLFFLCDFVFGMIQSKKYSNEWILIFAIFLLNPIMILPYFIFKFVAQINLNLGLFGLIGKHSLEIFLFHESLMKILLGKMTIYGLDRIWSFIVLIILFIIIAIISDKLKKKIFEKIFSKY